MYEEQHRSLINFEKDMLQSGINTDTIDEELKNMRKLHNANRPILINKYIVELYSKLDGRIENPREAIKAIINSTIEEYIDTGSLSFG